MSPEIRDSALKHGLNRQQIMHAFNNPICSEDLDDGFVMIVGPDIAANLLEVGVVASDAGPIIVHAMVARDQYVR